MRWSTRVHADNQTVEFRIGESTRAAGIFDPVNIKTKTNEFVIMVSDPQI
jgi:hypothetical protein